MVAVVVRPVRGLRRGPGVLSSLTPKLTVPTAGLVAVSGSPASSSRSTRSSSPVPVPAAAALSLRPPTRPQRGTAMRRAMRGARGAVRPWWSPRQGRLGRSLGTGHGATTIGGVRPVRRRRQQRQQHPPRPRPQQRRQRPWSSDAARPAQHRRPQASTVDGEEATEAVAAAEAGEAAASTAARRSRRRISRSRPSPPREWPSPWLLRNPKKFSRPTSPTSSLRSTAEGTGACSSVRGRARAVGTACVCAGFKGAPRAVLSNTEERPEDYLEERREERRVEHQEEHRWNTVSTGPNLPGTFLTFLFSYCFPFFHLLTTLSASGVFSRLQLTWVCDRNGSRKPAGPTPTCILRGAMQPMNMKMARARKKGQGVGGLSKKGGRAVGGLSKRGQALGRQGPALNFFFFAQPFV